MSRIHLRVRVPADSTTPPSNIRVHLTSSDSPNAAAEEPRGGPIKIKWKSFVRFFALPIREYYRQPPGETYRQRQIRRRRGDAFTAYNYSDDDEPYHGSWLRACPVYNSEVGDDEMVLSKAAEARQESQRLSIAEIRPTVTSEDYYAQDGEQVEEVEAVSNAEATIPAEDAPHYDVVFPSTPVISEEAAPSTKPAGRRRPHTAGARSSSLFGIQTSSYEDGASIERQTSTPIASSARPAFLGRSNRSNSTATLSGGRQISEPLTWTLVRSQYSYPKRGLSEQQLRFLSSVESLGRYGVPSAVNTPVATTPGTESPGYFSPRPDSSL